MTWILVVKFLFVLVIVCVMSVVILVWVGYDEIFVQGSLIILMDLVYQDIGMF